MKLTKQPLIYIPAALISIAALATSATLALFIKSANSNGSYGEIGLRSYFECGSGKEDDPYVITRPRHMYNFSRLQGLGVFGEKKYFQLGLEGLGGADESRGPLCYLSDSSSTTVPFLDMSSSNYSHEPIIAIGSESVPFYGEFDGQYLEIKNLTIYADPEDAGLFGYTAHGSTIHDLFLDNVTINTTGYTAAYKELYTKSGEGEEGVATLDEGVSFTYYTPDENPALSGTSLTLNVNSTDYGFTSFYAKGTDEDNTVDTDDFVYNNEGVIPDITYSCTEKTGYKYKTLVSGDLITESTKTVGGETVPCFAPDLERVFQFFGERRTDVDSKFPLQASSSVSIIAAVTDSLGLEHTSVLLTLECIFTLESLESTRISMETRIGNEHGNNIGLIIGHCDGTLSNCYVHDGSFIMNNGDAITASEAGTYSPMTNGSSLGLVGLVGNTVRNRAAEEADAATKAGKSVGVLDFTTIYNEIISDTSFANSASLAAGGVSYVPINNEKYLPYLRMDDYNRYVTYDVNTISFNRQKVISNNDLGVFTIATDFNGTGMAGDSGHGLERSIIRTENVWSGTEQDKQYYLYYATGEYNKANAQSESFAYSDFRNSFNSDAPNVALIGHHLPSKDEITVDSFEQRELHHNYYFRFKLSPSYRAAANSFYFSDLDTKTPGGSYLSKYFNYKLVDNNSIPIPIGSNKCGVMLRNSANKEIGSFSANFTSPDNSHSSGDHVANWPKMYTIQKDEYEYHPAANMINFEIKTEYANVTIVAGKSDVNKAAAIGIYKIDNSDYKMYSTDEYINQDYDDPDFAFFLPNDEHLAYFDYELDGRKGRIGTRDSSGTFTEATVSTEAYEPSAYNTGTEYGYNSDRTRLFIHTFKLPQGRYCVGSATGESMNGYVTPDYNTYGTAKVYYLCAQGQSDGQLDFSNNVFSGNDIVEKVDFVKTPRFTYDDASGATTETITIPDEATPVTTYDAGSSLLDNRRCYVMLAGSDRSLFAAKLSNIVFQYADNKFRITSSALNAMTHVASNSYGSQMEITGLPNTVVSLFGTESSETIIAYTYTE